jgi:hypothetical protein
LQVDMSPVSFAHRYTARPEPLARTVPSEDLAVVMTVPPDALAPLLEEGDDDAPAGDAGAAAPALLLVPALLHAATTTAATSPPPTPATSLVRLDTVLMDTGLNLDFRIVLASCRRGRPRRLCMNHCR